MSAGRRYSTWTALQRYLGNVIIDLFKRMRLRFDTLFDPNALFYWFNALVCFRQCIKVVNLYVVCASSDIQSKGPMYATCRLFRIKRNNWHENSVTRRRRFSALISEWCAIGLRMAALVESKVHQSESLVAFSFLTHLPVSHSIETLKQTEDRSYRDYYILKSTHTHTHTHTHTPIYRGSQ